MSKYGSAPAAGLISSGGRLFEVLFFCSAISASILLGGILFDAFSNSLVFADAELMYQRRLKHLICLSFCFSF
jgi:hypothetical protein